MSDFVHKSSWGNTEPFVGHVLGHRPRREDIVGVEVQICALNMRLGRDDWSEARPRFNPQSEHCVVPRGCLHAEWATCILLRIPSSGMWHRGVLVTTDVSEERIASTTRVKTTCELGPSPWWRRRYVPPKRRFLQEPHGVTSQKTAFFRCFIVPATNRTPSPLPWAIHAPQR
jgi:hypothetical protein